MYRRGRPRRHNSHTNTMASTELTLEELRKVNGGAKKGLKVSFLELSNISRFSELSNISRFSELSNISRFSELSKKIN